MTKELTPEERHKLATAPFPVVHIIPPQKGYGNYGAYKGRTLSEWAPMGGGNSGGPIGFKGSKYANQT